MVLLGIEFGKLDFLGSSPTRNLFSSPRLISRDHAIPAAADSTNICWRFLWLTGTTRGIFSDVVIVDSNQSLTLDYDERRGSLSPLLVGLFSHIVVRISKQLLVFSLV